MATDLKNFWLSEGYIVVRGLFIPERTEQLGSICEEILQQWYCKNPETGEPGGNADAVAMRHLNHPGYFDHAPESLNYFMDAVADDAVIEVGLKSEGLINKNEFDNFDALSPGDEVEVLCFSLSVLRLDSGGKRSSCHDPQGNTDKNKNNTGKRY